MALIELPWCWLPLFLVTAFFMICSIFITETPSGMPVHGIRGRSDFNTTCNPSQREQFDTTFLSCEDGTFWLWSHIISPCVLQVLLGMPELIFALDVYWEVGETVALTFTGSFIIYKDTIDQFETTAGSLAGDVLFCGIPGILLGMLLGRWSGFPGLLPLVIETQKNGFASWNGYKMSPGTGIWRLSLATLLVGVNFLYAGVTTESGIMYGGYIAMAVVSVELLFIVPLMIKSTDSPFVDLSATYARVKWPLVFSVLLIGLANSGVEFLANNYFQSWVFYFVCILVVFIVANVELQLKRTRKRRGLGSRNKLADDIEEVEHNLAQ